jgi:methylase of polypeptide subunit release factors
MPRLTPIFIRQAASVDTHLPLLLRYCRDLPSAQNELRWLKEHARTIAATRIFRDSSPGITIRPVGHNKEPDLPGTGRVFIDLNDGQEIEPSTKKDQLLGVQMRRFRSVECIDRHGRFNTKKYEREMSKGEKSLERFTGVTDRILQNVLPNEPNVVQSTTPSLRKRLWANNKAAHKLKTPQLEEDSLELEKKILARMVVRRSRGKPLQYIIGNQPFGNLEIKCHEEVLIPRPETETYTEQVGQILSHLILNLENESTRNIYRRKRIRILDLCTGTGCIALLLHSLLKPPPGAKTPCPALSKAGLGIEVLGLDISDRAVNLARLNLQHNIKKGLIHPDAQTDIHFATRDIRDIDDITGKVDIKTEVKKGSKTQVHFNPEFKNQSLKHMSWDIVIANPPYISSKEFTSFGVVEKSVRKYEPRLALVPPEDEYESQDPSRPDRFYRSLVEIAHKLDASLLVMEVGDTEQANRVLYLARKNLSFGDDQVLFESWRDDGSVRRDDHVEGFGHEPEKKRTVSEEEISDRVVVCWRSDWGAWRRRSSELSIAKNDQPAVPYPSIYETRGSRYDGTYSTDSDHSKASGEMHRESCSITV